MEVALQRAQSPDPPSIFKLADDLLYDIVLLSMHFDDTAIEPRFTRRTAPFVISSVCKRWREFAINAASLWSEIHFNVSSPYPFQTLLLERSKTSPLNITINDLRHFPRLGLTSISALVTLLRPHVCRIKTLSIACIDSAERRRLTDELRASAAPSLEELTLYGPTDSTKWKLEPFEGQTWKLSKLVVGCGRLNSGRELVHNLRWLELGVEKSLFMMEVTTFEILTLIYNAPCLETLILWMSSLQLGLGSRWKRPQILALNLRTLEVVSSGERGRSSIPVVGLLKNIIAPQLECMKSFICSSHEYWQPLVECPRFPFPGLTRFSMIRDEDLSSFQEMKLTFFLWHLPNLQTLDITHRILSGPVSATISTSCPNLTEMVVTFSGKFQSMPILKSIIIARQDSPYLNAIKVLRLVQASPQAFAKGPTSEDLDWLKAHVKNVMSC